MTEDFRDMWKRAEGVARTSSTDQEIRRILDLPVVGTLTSEELEAFNQIELLPEAFKDGFRLFPVQAEAVLAYDKCQGLFAPVGVGHGKALMSVMIASRAYLRGIGKIILFNPPSTIAQFKHQVLPWARTKVPISCPFIYLDGKGPKQRQRLAQQASNGVYVMPYSLLSQPDSEDFLEALAPELLIFDEAHYIKARKRARTRRVMKYITTAKPQTVYLSGTMTQKSILDYHHLITSSLHNRSPLPLPASIAESWAASVDAGAESEPSGQPRGAALRPLVSWARGNGLDVPENLIGARRAYRFRLTSAPGVVSTPDDDIGVSLLVRNLPVPDFKDPVAHPEWETLNKHMQAVDQDWISPSGDEINHAFHKWRYLDELSAGFYHLLEWPTAEALSERRRISHPEAAELIERAVVHHDALQDYNKVLRKFLSRHHIRGLDTPMLVGRHLSTEGAKGIPGYGPELFEAWTMAKSLEFPNMPERQGRPIRVSPYKIKHAANWAREIKPKGAGALIWYHHQAVGKWLVEELTEAGFEVLHCPAGEMSNRVLARVENHKHKLIVISLSAHSEGKNLQAIQEQFYVQFPRVSRVAQQSIGRTHRSGQTADELIVTKCDTTEFDQMNFAACLVDATYQHGSGGNRQKLVYATYESLPRMFPPEFLLERGLEVARLDAQERKLLTEKFGSGNGSTELS